MGIYLMDPGVRRIHWPPLTINLDLPTLGGPPSGESRRAEPVGASHTARLLARHPGRHETRACAYRFRMRRDCPSTPSAVFSVQRRSPACERVSR